jgi:molecular chaperone GrpE
MDINQPNPAADSQKAPDSVDPSAPANSAVLLSAQKDHYLHLPADFDKFKKRARSDSEPPASGEKESFIHDLLPILDDLERALGSGRSVSSGRLHQDVALALQELVRLLHHHGIEIMVDVGHPFDPRRHETISVRRDHHCLIISSSKSSSVAAFAAKQCSVQPRSE